MPIQLPPDYEQRKRALLTAKGLDPLKFDIDLDRMSIVPRKEAPAGPWETAATTAAYNIPEAATSVVGSRVGAGLVTALAGALSKAPHPLLRAAGMFGGAIAAPMLTSEYTEPIKEAISPGITSRIRTMAADEPWAAVAGEQASALPFFKFANPMKMGAANVAAGAGLGAGIPIAQDYAQDQDINIPRAVGGAVGGAFISNPTRLGSRLLGQRQQMNSMGAEAPPAKPWVPDGPEYGPFPVAEPEYSTMDTGERVHDDTGFQGWTPPPKPIRIPKQPTEDAAWETQGGDYEQPDFPTGKPIYTDKTPPATPVDPSGPPAEWRGRQPILREQFEKQGLDPDLQDTLSGYAESGLGGEQQATVGTPEAPPIREPKEVLQQQVKLALEPRSTRAAVLFTPGEVAPASVPVGLRAVDTPHGVVYYNPQKVTIDQILKGASGKTFDTRLLGMSNPGAEQTWGDRVVTTSTPEAKNVAAEVIPRGAGPLGIQQAAAAQQASVPGGTTEVKKPSILAQERMALEAEEAAQVAKQNQLRQRLLQRKAQQTQNEVARRLQESNEAVPPVPEEPLPDIEGIQDAINLRQVRSQDQAKKLKRQKETLQDEREDAPYDPNKGPERLGSYWDEPIEGSDRERSSGPLSNEMFKRWFGDSKVIDAEGKPLAVYHGSNRADFDEFDTNKSGYHYGPGAYFSPDPNRASHYATKNIGSAKYLDYYPTEGPNVRKTYVKLEKPFVVGSDASVMDLAQKLSKENRPLYDKLAAEVAKKYRYSGPEAVGTAEVANAYLRQQGYDGIIKKWKIGTPYEEIIEVVAFDPRQIKSATGNRGTYDPENPMIMYSGLPVPNFLRGKVKSKFGPPEEDVKQNRRTGLNPFRSEVDKLRAAGPQQAEAADAFDRLYNTHRQYNGRYANPVLGALDELPPEQQQTVYETLIQEERVGRDLSSNLAPEEKKAYDTIRSTLKQMAVDQQAAGQMVRMNNGIYRTRGQDPFFAPNIIDRGVHRILAESQGSSAFNKLKKEFVQWQTQHGQSNEAAEKNFTKLLGSFEGSMTGETFKGARMPQGMGLPDSWIERDPMHAFRVYVNRFTRDRAFYDTIETNPRLMQMLGKDMIGDKAPVPKELEDVINLANDEQVQRIRRNYIGLDAPGNEPIISGVARVVNAALLSGPVTKLTDIGTVPFKALAYVPEGQADLIIKGISEWRQGYKDAFDYGFNRRGGTVVAQDILGIGEAAADKLSRAAEVITKITGSEQLELLSRGLSQSIGNFIAESHIMLAKNGNRKSIEFLNKLGSDWRRADPKELGTRVGQLLQGRYDITNLPRWAINSNIAPFVSMMRWSIEQTNNFLKFVVDPLLKNNDMGPLIKTLIGGLGGGLLLSELREEISGKKGYVATWKELEEGKDKPGYRDALTYKLIGAAQVTGTAGILSELMRQSYEGLTGRMPQGFRYPVISVGGDVLKRLGAGIVALRDGEDPTKVAAALTKDVLSRHVQMARIIKNQLGKSGKWKQAERDIEHSNMMRDEDVYNRMTDKPQAAKVEAPPSYSRLTEKEFDDTEDLNEAASLAPRLIERGFKRAAGRPQVLKSEMNKLRTIDVRGMPSPKTDPAGFIEYYNWIAETQGQQKASQLASKFLQRQASAEAKRGMIPSVE